MNYKYILVYGRKQICMGKSFLTYKKGIYGVANKTWDLVKLVSLNKTATFRGPSQL